MPKMVGMVRNIDKPRPKPNSDDVLTPSEAKKVRHGMKQIREGRFRLWRDVKQELLSRDCKGAVR